MTLTRLNAQRGFTLIELLLVVGISSILGTTFFSVMYLQNSAYLTRLDEVDAHQDARASLNVMRRYIHGARWGIDPNAIGEVPIGVCYNTSTPTTTQTNCNNLATDNGADRLRVIAMNDEPETVANNSAASEGPCTTGSTDTAKISLTNQTVVNPLTANTLALVAGNCGTAPAAAASTLIYVLSDAGAANGCNHRYNYTILSGASTLCGTASSSYYAAGFNFGRATVADFYIAPGTTTTPPELMIRTDPRAPILSTGATGYQPQIVAFDIEDLQIRYGIDTTTPTDRAVDVWCDDPRTTYSSGGGTGSCTLSDSTGASLTTAAQLNRIMAVQATVRVRTDNKRPGLQPNPLNPNLIVANPVTNPYDGYQRWIYTTTVMLRNNPI